MKIKILLLTTIFSFCIMKSFADNDYKAVMFGIKSDGVTNNTRAIQKAVDYISENGGGTLKFYVGRYVSGGIELKSNVTIRIEEGAVLIATPSIYDYKEINGKRSFITAEGQKNVGIGGKGIIDGFSSGVNASIQSQIENGFIKGATADFTPSIASFVNCENVKVEQITFDNSSKESLNIANSKDVVVENININPTNGNKAINVVGSQNVKFKGCYFNTDDDASLKKENNVVFEDCKTPKGNLK